MMKNYLKQSISILLMVFSGTAYSAAVGLLDHQTEETIRISLQISPSIRIDTVDSINLLIVDRSVDTNFTESLCITGNFGGKYNITAYGSNDGSDNFSLSNSEGEALNYFVAYRGSLQNSQYDDLSPGSPSPTYDLLFEEFCSDQQSFKITFRTEDLNRVGSGLYTGHLTLLVSPV